MSIGSTVGREAWGARATARRPAASRSAPVAPRSERETRSNATSGSKSSAGPRGPAVHSITSCPTDDGRPAEHVDRVRSRRGTRAAPVADASATGAQHAVGSAFGRANRRHPREVGACRRAIRSTSTTSARHAWNRRAVGCHRDLERDEVREPSPEEHSRGSPTNTAGRGLGHHLHGRRPGCRSTRHDARLAPRITGSTAAPAASATRPTDPRPAARSTAEHAASASAPANRGRPRNSSVSASPARSRTDDRRKPCTPTERRPEGERARPECPRRSHCVARVPSARAWARIRRRSGVAGLHPRTRTAAIDRRTSAAVAPRGE